MSGVRPFAAPTRVAHLACEIPFAHERAVVERQVRFNVSIMVTPNTVVENAALRLR